MSSIANKIKEGVTGHSTSSGEHLAAVLPKTGSPLEIIHRPTPKPGPHDLLVEVKAIALNPIDFHQRDHGFPPLAFFPAILGSDVGGTVIAAGSDVDPDAPKPGTRVAVFAPCFFKQGQPDYGAFQQRVLVPAANVTPLPHGISFVEASLLPMAVITAWSGIYTAGVPRDTVYAPMDGQALLVWGGASSIGSAAVQVAHLMGFRVYVTASTKHHDYLKGLGASRLFDYKDENVVQRIVEAAREDGVVLKTGFDAVGQLMACSDVLKEFAEDGTARLAEAIPPPEDAPKVEGVEAKFVMAPQEEQEQIEFFHFVFRNWLTEKLRKGEFVPSPKIQMVGIGLESLQTGLDELKKGVSGVKLVVEL